MKTKNKILLIVILAIIVFGAGWILILTYRDSIPIENLQTKNESASQQITVEDKKIIDNTKPFKIDITYPYIASLPEFNQKVEEIINKETESFKTIALENDQAVKETDPESYAKYPREYDLIFQYEKGLVKKDVVSIVFNISNYTGGAHGANYFISLNYNPETNKEIKLSDLFLNQPDYLQTISGYCIKDLKKQIQEITGDDGGAWIETGAGPLEENFSIFLINKDSITFYFPQYQVAAYALGSFKVTMPK